MIIDSSRLTDQPVLRRLWQEAFGDRDVFLDGFFREGFSDRRSRCLWMDGHLAAALYWFDCTWGEKKLAYVYAVATDKAFRGRGLCTALMEDTHRHLASRGYDGVVLVPGNEGLFTLYEKLGYRAFCPMELKTLDAAGTARVRELSGEEFVDLRRRFLPADCVLQEGETVAYLRTFARFYAGEGCLFCASAEGDTLYFQEFLGDAGCLPGVIAALGAKKGVVRLPGGSDWAMYFPLDQTGEIPGYFGISLG